MKKLELKSKIFKNLAKISGYGFDGMTENELKFISGGTTTGGGGSQTSNTGSQSQYCCDATCVCICLPPGSSGN